MREAIRAGIRVIHISTEIRIAWRNALGQTLANHPRDIVPYHILPEVIRAIEFVIEEKIKQVYTENN
jgi:fructose/tagatose bisphosphate aldolase